MESSPSQDLGLTDAHNTLSTLDYIVHFLHTEGFYAAEEALLREIENRYPEGDDTLQGTDASISGRSANTATPEDSAAFVSADSAEQSNRYVHTKHALAVVLHYMMQAGGLQCRRLAANTGSHTDRTSPQAQSAALWAKFWPSRTGNNRCAWLHFLADSAASHDVQKLQFA